MIKGKTIYWIAGALTAFAGVTVVRVLSQEFSGNHKIAAMLVGYTLSIFGLFVITLGTRRSG